MTLSNSVVGLSGTTMTLSNSVVGLSGTTVALSNSVVGLSSTTTTLSNSVVGLSSTTTTLSNSVVGLSGTTVALSNSVVGLSGTTTTLSNSVVGLSNNVNGQLLTLMSMTTIVSGQVASLSNSITSSSNVRVQTLEIGQSTFSSSNATTAFLNTGMVIGGDLDVLGSIKQNGIALWTLDATSLWTSAAPNVGIGMSNPSYALHVNGNICAVQDIIALSDARFKSELQVIDNALERVTKLTGYTYVRSDLESKKRFSGVLAQDVEKVLPEAVYEDSGNLSVSYMGIIPMLIEAIKDLSKRLPLPLA